jgi:hypothetical protein
MRAGDAKIIGPLHCVQHLHIIDCLFRHRIRRAFGLLESHSPDEMAQIPKSSRMIKSANTTHAGGYSAALGSSLSSTGCVIWNYLRYFSACNLAHRAAAILASERRKVARTPV